jgi:hypothetical protein
MLNRNLTLVEMLIALTRQVKTYVPLRAGSLESKLAVENLFIKQTVNICVEKGEKNE